MGSRRRAGGSNSGSAASMGAGVGYGSIGTDTGGSTRLPAALCGLVGLKPTYGAIDCGGVMALSPTLDHIGVLTRSIDDNRLLHHSLTAEPADHPQDRLRPVDQLRMGVVTDLCAEPFDDDVRVVFDAAIQTLRAVGTVVSDVDLPSAVSIGDQAMPIMLAEAAYQHQAWFPARAGDYASGTRRNLQVGAGLPAVAYIAALEARRRFTHSVTDRPQRSRITPARARVTH